jgi:signal transduction histidine kinase/phage shock protein PspC (stress-responsive transcriptional regulator)
MLGGVAAGVAQHLGVSRTAVRLFFALSMLAAGFGVVTYILLWILTPVEDGGTAVRATTRRLRRPSRGQLAGIGLVFVGVAVLLAAGGLWFGDLHGWPVVLAAIGFAVLWARSGDDGRGRWDLSRVGGPMQALVSTPVSPPRLALGSLLIAAAAAVFLAANTSVSAVGNTLLAIAVAIGGLALLAGPWIWRLANQLIEERASRVRADARAEVAAHLHDSVLQTLALMQRSSEPRAMASLARTQERELRAWLYGRTSDAAGAHLRDAVEDMAGRVEAQHRVRVEAITVGDAPIDARLRALIAALGEATTNAAVHSDAASVAVYAEVENGAVTAYVRDQGTGFDPDAVPEDRHGIRESIVGRLARHGGTATITSGPMGTEVVLRLPRSEA